MNLSHGSAKPEMLAYIYVRVSQPSLETISTPYFICLDLTLITSSLAFRL
jgi:hypothetical protein